jgi:MYXO-CTERM domain-containing protein
MDHPIARGRLVGVRVAGGKVFMHAFEQTGTAPSIAPRDDQGFLLVWAVAGVVAMPLDRIGAPAGPPVLFTSATWPERTEVVSIDGQYLAAWTDDGTTYLADLDADGFLIGGTSIDAVWATEARLAVTDGGALLLARDERGVSTRTVAPLHPDPDDPIAIEGGCGCGSGDGELGLLVVAAVLLAARYSRRRWTSTT